MYGGQPQPSTSRSPPPGGPTLQHPVPTHPMYIPEPPTTPISPQGYQRYTSSPQPPVPPGQSGHAHGGPSMNSSPSMMQQQQQQPMLNAPGYGFAPHNQPQGPGLQPGMSGFGYPQFQSFGGGVGAQGGPMSPPQHQHGSPGQQPGQLAPNFAAWGVNDMTAQFGMQLGQNAVQAGQDYMQRNFGGSIPLSALKHHFSVSNSYVMNKLQLLLFPWRRKYRWARRVTRNEAGHAEWLTPREDLNSPDLYIPVMAFVTYILLAAIQRGLQERFHPEVLGLNASRAFAVAFVDAAFIKLGCYILAIQGPSEVLDVMAYVGYKFVGVILVLVASLLQIRGFSYTCVFAYAFIAQAFFLLRSLRSVVLPDPANTQAETVSTAQRSRRIMFLFIVAASQLLYMGILVRV